MSEAPLIIALLIGITVGCAIIVFGIHLGFKLSAEIRAYKGDDTVESTLNKPKQDPGEFDLLDEKRDKEEKQ